jgi:hypothetical protein
MFSLPRLLDRPLGRSKFPTYKNDPSQWEMRQQFPAAKPIAAFGREHNGSFVCFDKSGRIVSVGGPPFKDRSFFDFLRRRITAEQNP